MPVTHGMPIVPVAKLSFDLAVFHWEAARQIYVAEGCRIKQVFIHGHKQDFRPMTETLPQNVPDRFEFPATSYSNFGL